MFTPNSFLPKVLVASKVYCIIGNNYKYKHTQLNLHFIQVLSCFFQTKSVDSPTLKQSRTLQCCNLNIYLYVFQIQFSQKSIQCIYISSHDWTQVSINKLVMKPIQNRWFVSSLFIEEKYCWQTHLKKLYLSNF